MTRAAGAAANFPYFEWDWWQSEDLRFTGKNFIVGAVVGGALGALAMHLYMKR